MICVQSAPESKHTDPNADYKRQEKALEGQRMATQQEISQELSKALNILLKNTKWK